MEKRQEKDQERIEEKARPKDMGRISEQKAVLREEYRRKRHALTEAQALERSARICRKLLTLPCFLQAETVYFYYPLGKEVSLLPAAEAALDMGKQVGFPKTEGTYIRFYRLKSLQDVTEGRFHVMEPAGSELLTEPAPLILTPGLVFDEKRNRMGYGKGYYDRYGAEFPKAVRIGIAYELQMAERIAVDDHDLPMDAVLTEERLIGERLTEERWLDFCKRRLENGRAHD